jgi:hypothetical protein
MPNVPPIGGALRASRGGCWRSSTRRPRARAAASAGSALIAVVRAAVFVLAVAVMVAYVLVVRSAF